MSYQNQQHEEEQEDDLFAPGWSEYLNMNIVMPDDPRLSKIVHVRSFYPNGYQRPPTPVSDPNRPWCRIFYYELNKKVGLFKAYEKWVTVDGVQAGQHTSTRMSLSRYIHPQVWEPDIYKIRTQAGKGVKFTDLGSSVVMTVLTNQPVFLQSHFVNHFSGKPSDDVLRIQNDPVNPFEESEKKSVTIYDKKLYGEELERQRQKGNDADTTLLVNLGQNRVSFIKGFNGDYPRKRACDCPVWLEIMLAEPLEAFDAFARRHERTNNSEETYEFDR